MFGRLMWRSFNRNWRKKGLLVVTVAVGISLATAVLTLSLDVGDKVSRELRRFGANINIEPAATGDPTTKPFLAESDLGKIKTIFWTNNIVSFAPFLRTEVEAGGQRVPLAGTWFAEELALPTGESVTAGVRSLKDWWQVRGRWPEGSGEVLVGGDLARRLGVGPEEELTLTLKGGGSRSVRVAGILDSGGEEDGWVLSHLSLVQELDGRQGQVERVEVSAITTPETPLARLAVRDPAALSAEAYELWYCTAYAGSIAYQLEETIPGARARPLQGISQAESQVLTRVQLLITVLSVLGFGIAILSISNLMEAKVRERQVELGLIRSLGASRLSVLAIFLGEALVEGLLGGLVGYLLGTGLAWSIGVMVFGIAITPQWILLPPVLVLAVLVTLAGSASSLGYLLRLQPAHVLRGV